MGHLVKAAAILNGRPVGIRQLFHAAFLKDLRDVWHNHKGGDGAHSPTGADGFLWHLRAADSERRSADD